MLQELDATEFTADHVDVAEARPILFHADWCGFCRRFMPAFEEAAEADDERTYLSVDVSDESSPLWDTFGVQAVPTVILFEDGEEVTRVAGMLGPDHMDRILAELPDT